MIVHGDDSVLFAIFTATGVDIVSTVFPGTEPVAQTMEIKSMNSPIVRSSNVPHRSKSNLSWLARNRGRLLGLLLLSLATVTIAGAYVKASAGGPRPTSVDKAAIAEPSVKPVSNSASKRAVQAEPQAGPGLIISEFRLGGVGGASDEYIEVNNNTAAAITVAASSGTGFGIAASDGILRCTIPNGTIIPARGHFLCANSVGYSYTAYPAGIATATADTTYTTEIPVNTGIALFNTNIPANFALATRLDAVGATTEANTLYREGAGYAPGLATTINTIDAAYVRKAEGLIVTNPPFGGTPTTGFPQDTDDNASDFIFVDTNGTSAGSGQRLGAPGPKNLVSPIFANANTPRTLVDPCVNAGTAPNKVRDAGVVTNGSQGTISLRRTYTNNTGAPLTRLRFRILNIATFPAAAGIADLRALSSGNTSVTVDRAPCGAGTSNITVQGTTLESDNVAPNNGQPNGGGFNSSLSAGSVTAATPLANGASIDVGFLFGIQQTGSYKLAVIVESLPAGGDLWLLQGNTEDASDLEGLPPTITATAGGITRVRATPASNSQIATVSDTSPGTLTVTATTVPAGITVTNIVNTNGNVTANVAAGCGAALGANTVVLTVTNGTTGQSATANLTVNVTANTPPVLTYPAAAQTAVFGGTATVNPATGPTDNGTVSTIVVQSKGTFTGIANVAPTGIVSLSNAAPIGTSTITIRATDDCGTTTDATFTVNVTQASTTTTLTSSANPSIFGQAVTFTATVAAVAPGSGLPTGTVTFRDGTTTLGTGTLNGAGQATFTTSTLSVGTHSITAVYAGDTNFTTSTSAALSQVVNKSTSATALTSSLNPSNFGQAVTFTATVTSTGPAISQPGGGPVSRSRTIQMRTTSITRAKGVTPLGTGTPTGTVTFLDGTTTIGTGTLNGSGVATLTISNLAVGSHPITAQYNGDASFLASTSNVVTQVVNKTNSTLSNVTSSANPSVFGQNVTFSTTIGGVGGGVATGPVTFFDNGVQIGQPVTPNSSNVATLTINTLAVGTHSITASFAGDANVNPSTTAGALIQTVNKDSTTTTVTSNLNPAFRGGNATVTATVTANPPGSGVPTGTVQFRDNGVNVGAPVTLVNGAASITLTNLPLGLHNITAIYSGDGNFLGSTSATFALVVAFRFVDPVNGNTLIIDTVNSRYTFIAGNGTTIVSNVPVVIQFATAGTRVLRFRSVTPIVTEVTIDESAPGTLQGKFYVPSTGQDFVMNINSGVTLGPLP